MGVMILSVGLGGAIGAVSRFAVSHLLTSRWGLAGWIPTLGVNITGCLLIGLLAGWAALSGQLSDTARGALAVGFLGSLTTFSSFTLDAYGFWARAYITGLILYLGLSVLCSLGAFAAGFIIIRFCLAS